MPWLVSTAIERAEYDADRQVLRIWFRQSGGPYDHLDVPEDVFHDLCTAPSAGQYYNEHIRDRYEVIPP